MRRDPHYFLPTTGQRYLLFGSDQRATQAPVRGASSRRADWQAHCRLQAEIGQLRDDVAPTWLEEPLTIEETAERYVRPALRDTFRRPLPQAASAHYLDRFGFKSDLSAAPCTR